MACSFEFENPFWNSGKFCIAGVDEAGRGPLAGPVVASAVILAPGVCTSGLDDSKRLSRTAREDAFERLTTDPKVHHATAWMDAADVDRLNILRAAHEAMRRAVTALAIGADHALIDGLPVHPFPIPHTAIVKGDGRSFSIAAASIIAKVTRDRIMTEYALEFPQYGFEKHMGYATAQHLASLRSHGPCRIHRRSFAPVAQTFLAL